MTEDKLPDEREKTGSEPAGPEDAQAGARIEARQPVTWRYVVGIVLVGVWVLALAVYGLDRALGLGFFPTKLERMLQSDVGRLTDADPDAAARAERELFEYHGFSVPFLIRGMRTGGERQKEACAACLRHIAAHYYGAKPDHGTDAEAWAKWWEKMDRAMTQLIDQEALREQEKIEEEARQHSPQESPRPQ